MHGILVVDKPQGVTSFDVVREVRRSLGIKKVGHTGTLDPMATGVLPICIGDATKIAQYLTEAGKSYDATIRLGVTTDTLDADGRVLTERPIVALETERIERALSKFRGTFLQTPPMYSAVKVGGKRLYELARAGAEVDRKPREVTVTSLVLRDFSSTELQISLSCSKGFFVRTLAAEIGEALGCGAHLSALRRTVSSIFTLAHAVPLVELQENPTKFLCRLVSIQEALAEWPALNVTCAEAERVRHGGLVEVRFDLTGLHRVIDPAGELLALADAEHGKLVYRRVLATEE